MAMKRGNGQGSIIKDKSGKRRKPFRARVTVGWKIDESTGKSKQIIKDLGTYATRREAEKVLGDYLDKPFDLKKKDITFSELYTEWYDYFMSKGNSSYEYRLKSTYKYCSQLYNKKIREITITDMRKCIDTGYVISIRGVNKGKEQLASPQTKMMMKFIFNHVFAYAAESRLVDRNYAKDFSLDKSVEEENEANKKPKFPFTEEEVEILWKSETFIPFVDMILVAIYGGWRPTEVATIRVDNIDLKEEMIKGGIKTRAGKDRFVPIHPRIMPLIENRIKEARELGSEYLFNDANNKTSRKGLSYDKYYSRFNNIMEQLDMIHNPHETRHTFATRAKKAKMDDTIRKLIMGHIIKDLTEKVYTHRDFEEFREEIRKIK